MATVNTIYKGKDWGDIVCSPEPLDQSDVLNYLQNCAGTERESLSRVLGNHYCNPIIRTISVKNLKAPPFQDRFDYAVSSEDLKNQDKTPIEVIYSFEPEAYIIIRGRGFFEKAKRKDIKELTCAIIGEVQHDFEAFLPRLSHVLTDHKPFHILEKARCIFEAKKLIIPRHGGNSLFGKGGNTRSKNFKKYNLIELLKKELPLKKYQIGVLNRLADNIGPTAIEGLYSLLKAKGKELSIFRVHKANPKMRKIGLRVKIDKKISSMEEDKDPEEIREAIGIMVYDVLFEKPKPPNNGELPADDEDDLDDDDVPDSGDDSSDDSGEGSGSDSGENETDTKQIPAPPEFNPISRKDLTKVKKLRRVYRKKVKAADDFLESKKEFTAEDSENFFKQKINDEQTDFTKFIGEYLKANMGK